MRSKVRWEATSSTSAMPISEAPNNVSVVGQGGVAVGAITPDRNNGNAVWMWMATDNFRLAAESAAMIVREVL